MATKIINLSNKKLEKFPTELNFLVLEDSDTIRNQMVKDLKSLGVTGNILEAACVQAAIKHCQTSEIDFIISDWNLPDGTGHDFLKKLRSVEKFKKTPFVMCTSNGELNYFLEAVASGANDFIVKPWTQEELKKKIMTTWEVFLNKK